MEKKEKIKTLVRTKRRPLEYGGGATRRTFNVNGSEWRETALVLQDTSVISCD